jgi:hypothetical protein
VVTSLAALRSELKKCRAEGLQEVELAYRAGHTSPPLRPFLLCTLKRLESAAHALHVTAKAHASAHRAATPGSPKQAKAAQRSRTARGTGPASPLSSSGGGGAGLRPAAQGQFEEGMGGFLDVLKHVERGDFGWLSLPPGARRELEDCRTVVEAAANNGWPEAMTFMGVLHVTGTHPVPSNGMQALSWFKKAAARGDPDGLYNLANCILEGEGTRTICTIRSVRLPPRWKHELPCLMLGGCCLVPGCLVPGECVFCQAWGWSTPTRTRPPPTPRPRCTGAGRREPTLSTRATALPSWQGRRPRRSGR